MSRKIENSNHNGKAFRRQLESIKRKKLSENKVVSLSEYRDHKRAEKRATVLVVDDEEIMRNALKRVLENENFNVMVAEDGFALSKVLETTTLDLILLDVNLPWVDGFELCHLVKSHESLNSVPVIMVSGRKSTEDIQKGMQLGATDFISKPFDVDHLVQSVQRALGKAV
ncbi:MAG: response regulator [Proteobacteria bacterium]|nr:response regulator [Pseudomonadota bacterium]